MQLSQRKQQLVHPDLKPLQRYIKKTSKGRPRPGSGSLNYVPTDQDFEEAQAAGNTLPAATKTARRYRPR